MATSIPSPYYGYDFTANSATNGGVTGILIDTWGYVAGFIAANGARLPGSAYHIVDGSPSPCAPPSPAANSFLFLDGAHLQAVSFPATFLYPGNPHSVQVAAVLTDTNDQSYLVHFTLASTEAGWGQGYTYGYDQPGTHVTLFGTGWSTVHSTFVWQTLSGQFISAAPTPTSTTTATPASTTTATTTTPATSNNSAGSTTTATGSGPGTGSSVRGGHGSSTAAANSWADSWARAQAAHHHSKPKHWLGRCFNSDDQTPCILAVLGVVFVSMGVYLAIDWRRRTRRAARAGPLRNGPTAPQPSAPLDEPEEVIRIEV